MSRRTRKALPRVVTWLSETVVDPNCLSSSFLHYKKFKFQDLVAEIGEFVLISNADAAEPDTEEGCDVARIVSLYEDGSNQNDPFRAKVQWYSRPTDIPRNSLNNTEPVDFLEREVIEDCRPFDSDVSIETFYKKCSVMFTFTKDTDCFFSAPYHYICRYRVMPINKRKFHIEPVIEEERQLATPAKSIASPKTPMTLIKRMSRVSLSEQKNWSVSKTDGTKLLLKRAILADKIDKDSPKKTSTKKLSNNDLKELLTPKAVLKESADSKIPTLIIRQSPSSLKSGQSSKTNEGTPKKALLDETHMSPYAKRLGRSARSKKSYAEEEISPVKQTTRKTRKTTESDDEPLASMSQLFLTSPKKRSSHPMHNEKTPKKALFDEERKSPYPKRSGRSAQKKFNYSEEEESPKKQISRKTRRITETDDEQSFSVPGKTPKKALFKENQNSPFATRLDRVVKNKINYIEGEVSPVKRTPRRPRTGSDDDLKRATKIPIVWIEEANIENTPVKTTPRRTRKVSQSDDDQNTPVKRTPRKARKVLQSDDDQNTPVKSTPSRARKVSQSDSDQNTPVKRNPRRAKKVTQSDDDQNTPGKRTPHRARKVSQSENDQNTPAKRTPSRARNVSHIDDNQNTPKRTSRRARKVSQSDEDFEPTPKPHKTPKTSRTPAQTPKQKISRKIISQLTPSLQPRAQPIETPTGFVKDKSLPGRESQLDEILSYVRSRIEDGSSGCMYISGVPGTGKTATVFSALNILKDEVDLPEFQLVEVNGMKIAEPRQAYVQIYKQLTGKTVVWEQACTLLEKRFTKSGPRRKPTVLIVDELDALCTRRQDVLYSIVEWASHNTAMLTVLAVANAMDLPERALAARVASRLGLTRLDFPPYTHTQLQKIVATRLAGANVTPDALQLIARKVAAVSGDARRALALCARAQELSADGGVGLGEVTKALEEASSGITIIAVRCAAPAERLMLRAIAQEVERTGTDETTLSRALLTAAAIMSVEGRPYKSAVHIRAPTYSQALAICGRLAASGLLLMEPRPAGHKLMLNISADDIYYATKEISA